MTNFKPRSIRPFIGCKDFNESRSFYRDLGFEETVLDQKMAVFTMGNFAFYLQDYYAKEWIENSMLFMEVEDADKVWADLQQLNLTEKYNSVKLTPMKYYDWGKECFVIDPAGVLWHFGQFSV